MVATITTGTQPIPNGEFIKMTGVTTAQFTKVNYCRYYLKAITAINLIDMHGNSIPGARLSEKWQTNSNFD